VQHGLELLDKAMRVAMVLGLETLETLKEEVVVEQVLLALLRMTRIQVMEALV
jgi:hypothetical protein